jgi:hypothetical protein
LAIPLARITEVGVDGHYEWGIFAGDKQGKRDEKCWQVIGFEAEQIYRSTFNVE